MNKKDDKSLTDEKLHTNTYQYDLIRRVVVSTFGDSFRNLSEKRKEKLIQRGVLIWMKGSNSVIHNALDAIHFPEKEFFDFIEQDTKKGEE